MILLASTSDLLRVVTSAAVNTDVQASWVDLSGTTPTPGRTNTLITTATTTTVVGSPGSSTFRAVKSLTVRNRSTTTAQTVTVLHSDGTNIPELIRVTLSAGEQLMYTDDRGFYVLDSFGRETIAAEQTGRAGNVFPFYKIGTAAEAIGSWYCWSKDTGLPGAWAPGTPGLNGRNTDGTTTTDNGCIRVPNAAGGLANYAYDIDGTANVVGNIALFDVLWVNSGLVVTTTTPQAITTPTLPARDVNGTTTGEGLWLGLLVTAATTNAGAITNITASYTDSDGNSGNTATMASFPATAVVGTVVWFELAAGDRGVQALASVTLGTSLVTGSVSVILARRIIGRGDGVVNVGAPKMRSYDDTAGVRLYDGACLLPFGVASATTARTIEGSLYVATR
jgi:hypothetical protein